MALDRGSASSSSAMSPRSAADRLELEAAEALAGLAHFSMRLPTADSAAEWGSKGKRLRKRVKSESPPSDPVLNSVDPAAAPSDLADEDQAKFRKQQLDLNGSSGLKDSVKAEQNIESVKLSPSSAARNKSTGRGRSRQNLTEAEREAWRLRRVLANRESARQTIRRRQALCEELTRKAAELAQENERLKREKELAFNEYRSLENTNKYLKAEVMRAIKAEQHDVLREVKSANLQLSAPPSTNCPLFMYNRQPFPPFCWPSMAQSSHQLQSLHAPQTVTIAPPIVSSQYTGNSTNGTKSPFLLVPCPWYFSLPENRNRFSSRPSCQPNDIHEHDETFVSNRFSASSSTKTIPYRENYDSSLDIKVENEVSGSMEEARINDLNVAPFNFSPDGVHPTGNFLVPTSVSSAGTTFLLKQENLSDFISNFEASSGRTSHSLNPSTVNNQESDNCENQKVLDAAEARKRRRELTKLKNLHGKQCRMQC